MNACSPLRITELAHDGSGLGFLGDPENRRGKAVFVRGSLPGQTVLWRPLREKKNFIEADIVAVLEEQGDLGTPLCAHSSECGACPLQRMPYDRQLYWKRRLAQEALIRIGGFERARLGEIWRKIRPSPLLREHRNKLELAFGKDSRGRPALGFRARKSHAVFEIRDCALLDESAMAIVRAVSQTASDRAVSGYLRHMVLRRARSLAAAEYAWHCLLITRPARMHEDLPKRIGEAALAAGAASFIHEERLSGGLLARGERRVLSLANNGGEVETMALELGGRLFEIDPGSFFQVNPGAAEGLADSVRGFCSGGALLDLYCGVGAPGQLLDAPRCLGIELDPASVALARRNAERNGLPRYSYRAGPAAKELYGIAKGAWEQVLVDPPRSGLNGEAVRHIMRIAPREIIYVSCDPATFARDAKILGSDYDLAAIQPVDMFPHTMHLECVGHFRSRN